MSLLMLLLAGGNAEAKKDKTAPRTAKNIVIAHRGYWNTPGAFENSIKAIDNAMNFGIYGSEFDINFTADDSIVVVHGSKHPVVKDLVIQESTFDKVRNTLLGNGEKVPTLREYLLAGKSDPSTQLILEIKKHPTPERENEIVAKTMAMVEELGLEKRDPVLYRIRHVAHYHLGNAWCVYPMYDFAHPIEDALEGVTHSMCTLEFEVHRPLYDWVVDRMDEQGLLTVRNGVKIRPHQREFARLNITWTVMSKRLLLQLVTEKHVSGWDDPRMPTVCAMRRRGFPPAAIRAFCERVGVTKIESESDPALLEWCVREELNKTAARRMAVLDPVKLVIENFTGTRTVTKPNNPLDAAAGTREIPFSRELWIDRADFQENPEKKFFRLAPGREVRLAGACIVTCTGFEKDAEGKITLIRCTWDEGSWGGNPSDGRKVKGTIHWVDAATALDAEVRVYSELFSDPAPDGADKDFLACMNPDSLEVLSGCKVEPRMRDIAAAYDKTEKKGKTAPSFQFMRLGYFCLDNKDCSEDHLVFNRSVTLKDSFKK